MAFLSKYILVDSDLRILRLQLKVVRVYPAFHSVVIHIDIDSTTSVYLGRACAQAFLDGSDVGEHSGSDGTRVVRLFPARMTG